eukprot:6486661-Karenia_brevis.AAC.1
MLQIAGLQHDTKDRPQVLRASSPKGLGEVPSNRGANIKVIKLESQEWEEGPMGLMSLWTC